MNAGLGDILKVQFLAFSANTKVYVASGEKFERVGGVELNLSEV